VLLGVGGGGGGVKPGKTLSNFNEHVAEQQERRSRAGNGMKNSSSVQVRKRRGYQEKRKERYSGSKMGDLANSALEARQCCTKKTPRSAKKWEREKTPRESESRGRAGPPPE